LHFENKEFDSATNILSECLSQIELNKEEKEDILKYSQLLEFKIDKRILGRGYYKPTYDDFLWLDEIAKSTHHYSSIEASKIISVYFNLEIDEKTVDFTSEFMG